MSSDIIIRDNHVTAFGIPFFRANAPSLSIGFAGDKEEPLFGQNYITSEDRVPAAKLKIRKAFTLSLASTDVTDKDIGLSITVPKLGSLSAGETSKQLRNETLKLVQFEIFPKDLVDAANASPGVLDTLKRIGNDGRLVHKIIVAMDAKTATSVTGAATLDVTATVAGVAISAGAGSSGTSFGSVDLSRCTFAYLLLKPKWDASMNKNWKRIVDWEEDRWSLG